MINKKSKILILFLLMFSLVSIEFAQVQTNPPMRQVLGTTGNTGTLPSGTTIDYTVGEVMVQTYSPSTAPFTIKTLTQGFQQPLSVSNSLTVDGMSVNSTCIGANNGSASLAVLASSGTVTYFWGPPLNSTNSIVTNLAPGTYYYTITDTAFTINDSVVITEDQIECGAELVFYKGITPNGDGNNDKWIIDGIENIPENKVSFYNRWGDLVWNRTNYDNVTVVWDGKNNAGKNLEDATYFYLVEAKGKTYKGYVEVTH
jgi:gliding motility-associated-like protein